MPQNSLSSRIFDKRLAANVKYSSSLFDFEQMMLSMASGVCFNLIEPTASILKSINKIIQFHHFRNFCAILKSLYIFSSTDCRDDSLGHKIFSSIIMFQLNFNFILNKSNLRLFSACRSSFTICTE